MPLMRDLDDAVTRSPFGCPGGYGCTCCRAGCDCGCRDDCPVFRRLIAGELQAAEAKEE